MPDSRLAKPLDAVSLAQAMIRCPSVTPEEAGVLDVLAKGLKDAGFATRRLDFAEPGTPDIANLYASIGSGSPHFCFAGHVDVVPVGDRRAWTVDPFAADIIDGTLYGRGAADMKAAIAAFVAAAAQHRTQHGGALGKDSGTISLLITGDEEGPAINGTRKMLQALDKEGVRFDACVVGEPTNKTKFGDMVKIGRRGSMTGHITVQGVQGHIAYPHLADNPVHRLARMMAALIEQPLDSGTEFFEASSLQFYTADVGNPTNNLIPAAAKASFNIRFNNLHTSQSLETLVRQKLDAVGGNYRLDVAVSGEAFFTAPGPLSALVAGAINEVTGKQPELSTTGGTSDARFIRDYCPVVEFGLVGQTMHKVDERAALADIAQLQEVYRLILERFFAPPAA
ncbi:MAG: succinyl-diaminopimelate desuccinylase [Alphaproteobacteria bacterium]|nr:succinyl-diaminopimelate desuccinylase [Alphaproteobacteria bacterium]